MTIWHVRYPEKERRIRSTLSQICPRHPGEGTDFMIVTTYTAVSTHSGAEHPYPKPTQAHGDIMYNIMAIVLFHKSQCAMRYRDPISKIQNTCSQRSLATWLTVAVNEQNDDWPASDSLVSVQQVIGWRKDEVARHWSHLLHRPCPHDNLPLPCIVRNGVWYCVKYSSLKSFYVKQRHPVCIPNHKMTFCGSVVWVKWQQIEKCVWYFAGLSQVFIF